MDVSIEELDLTDLSRKRPIVFDKIDITVAHNTVGSFVLEMAASDRAWELIQLDGSGNLLPVGIVVNWDGVYEFSGHVEDWSFKRALSDGRIVETLTLTGSDWLSLLANRIAYPTPAAAWAAQTITSTTYTSAHAETVIKDIVTANLKTAGDTARRVPLLTVAADAGRGGPATYKVVPPNPAATTGTETSTVALSLMDMVRAVALQAPIGVRIVLGAGELIFDVYVPRDLTEQAVFSATLGNLPEAGLTVTDPTANVILLQSKVTGATFSQAAGAAATDPWRRVEQYVDQSSTDTAADITTAANEAVAAGAGTVQLAVTVVDLPRLRFGADASGVQGYREGDTVTVDIRDGVSFSDVVSKVQLVADSTGTPYTATVTPTIGTDADTSQAMPAKLAAKLRALERALRGSI